MKVYIQYPFTDEQVQKIEDLGVEIIDGRDASSRSMREQAEGLITIPIFDQFPMEEWKNLRYIQSLRAGVNGFPLKEIEKRNITLTNAKHIYSRPIAEWVVMRILEANKKAKYHFQLEEKRKWELDLSFPEITGKKIGFLGTGSIAQETAKLLQVFDAHITGYNTDGRAIDYFDICYPLRQIEETVSALDVLVLAAPETAELMDFVDGEFLSHLHEEILLINIGRGTIIDEVALEQFLNENKNALAILDVFKTEPLPDEHPFWTMENVWVSPHVSASSSFIDERLIALTEKNLEAYLKGDPLTTPVDPKKGY